MASSAFDPLHVPEGFWRRDDVGNALDHRDIGALFRLLSQHAGASQTRIGIATGMSQGSVCIIMNDDRVVSALDVLDASRTDWPCPTWHACGLASHRAVDCWA